MVDVLEAMLRTFLDAIQSDDRKLLAQIARMDDTLDRLHNAIKLYLIEISREDDGLDEEESRRCSDILAFVINLEHSGDIVDKSLREIAAKKIKYRLRFSSEGLEEIVVMHARLLNDLKLAVGVFMNGNARDARMLLDAKVRMRDLEQAATENHLRRLREGRPESVETSALHLDIVRDLKRIAGHVAAVAYPILDQSGALRRSRVVDGEEAVASDESTASQPNSI
jgi:phosphate:Na+ symporter